MSNPHTRSVASTRCSSWVNAFNDLQFSRIPSLIHADEQRFHPLFRTLRLICSIVSCSHRHECMAICSFSLPSTSLTVTAHTTSSMNEQVGSEILMIKNMVPGIRYSHPKTHNELRLRRWAEALPRWCLSIVQSPSLSWKARPHNCGWVGFLLLRRINNLCVALCIWRVMPCAFHFLVARLRCNATVYLFTRLGLCYLQMRTVQFAFMWLPNFVLTVLHSESFSSAY